MPVPHTKSEFVPIIGNCQEIGSSSTFKSRDAWHHPFDQLVPLTTLRSCWGQANGEHSKGATACGNAGCKCWRRNVSGTCFHRKYKIQNHHLGMTSILCNILQCGRGGEPVAHVQPSTRLSLLVAVPMLSLNYKTERNAWYRILEWLWPSNSPQIIPNSVSRCNRWFIIIHSLSNTWLILHCHYSHAEHRPFAVAPSKLVRSKGAVPHLSYTDDMFSEVVF